MRTSARGLDAIEASEAYREYAYPDPESALAKATRGVRWGFSPARTLMATLPPEKRKLSPAPWTVGFGQTAGVDMDSMMTIAEARLDLHHSIGKYETMVNAACSLEPTQNQFDALVNLAWNCPVAVRADSSIIKAHNRGDFAAAAKAFDLYCKSKGVVNQSLLARRRRESAMYLEHAVESQPSPQVVDEPKPLTASKINMAQTAAGATAGIAAVNEVVTSINSFKAGIEGLGQWVLPIALVAIVALCAFTVWQRAQMRKSGQV